MLNPYLASFVKSLDLTSLVHHWYPLECCSNKDCRPVPCDSLVETATGYTYMGMEFLSGKVKPSLDGLCHVCYTEMYTPLCLFIQMNT